MSRQDSFSVSDISSDFDRLSINQSSRDGWEATEDDPPQSPQCWLPCLQDELIDCPAEFRADQFYNWYQHCIDHYADHGPPKRSTCIFCNETFGGGDRYASWERRMCHIYKHLVRGADFDSRMPDHEDLRYLVKHHLIPVSTYNDAIQGADFRPIIDDREEKPSKAKKGKSKEVTKSSGGSRDSRKHHDSSSNSHSNSASRSHKKRH